MDMTDVEVIYKNEPLMYFKCKKYDTTIIVCAGISCAYYGLQLPVVGTKLNIENVPHHFHGQYSDEEFILSLCHKGYPKSLKSEDLNGDSNTLLRMIPKYKLGCGDLVIIMKMYEMVKSTTPPDVDLVPFILTYIDQILSEKEYKDIELPTCQLNQLHRIKCLTISNCKQIQELGNCYQDFPCWSFGTRWSLDDELLIGSIFFHPKMGTICFKDSLTTVGCVIVKDAKDDLRDILDKPVYIEKFCIFSEIFNPNTKFNLEYLYLNFKNIHFLGNKRKRETELPHLKYQMTFLLLNKSNVTYTQERGSHFWIEITDIKYYNKHVGRCFLCLPERFIKYWSLLEISCFYTMSFNKDLIKIRDYEYSRVNSSLPQFQLRPNNFAVIRFNQEYAQLQKLPYLNVDTLPEILQMTGLVSFRAILKYRKFNPNNSSRTSTLDTPFHFGSIGEKTHLLDFQVDKVKTLTLYLNNWERMMNPLGLLPGAVINVRNVLVQKTYLKSTAFTSLELVEYNPRCKFQTASLFREDEWGLTFYFGGSNNLPDGILVYSVIHYYRVIKMFMKRSCIRCSYMSRIPGKTCAQCRAEMETICELLVVADDGKGSSKITIKRPEVCRVFLGMDQVLWDNLLSTLEVVGHYRFQRHGTYVNHALNQEQVRFMRKMNKILREGEKRQNLEIHLLCRKLDNSRSFDKSQPLWYGLKARLEECTS